MVAAAVTRGACDNSLALNGNKGGEEGMETMVVELSGFEKIDPPFMIYMEVSKMYHQRYCEGGWLR